MGARQNDRDAREGSASRGSRARLVCSSLANFLRLAGSRRLHLSAERLGSSFRLFDGQLYRVFRETRSALPVQEHTVFEVGFRLRLVGSAWAPHWLFQRVCILTTPFWSGFAGFGTKLWMVEERTRSYAGIYEWGGSEAATAYIAVLMPILRFVSVTGSVAYRLHEDIALSEFLASRGAGDSF
ncbi:MAG TPA: hypothetical protein VLJ80_02750 [Solirubrobacteraceae bacterium]|nr:hypothetical protein [Solirubrobacteraceae bacterium]